MSNRYVQFRLNHPILGMFIRGALNAFGFPSRLLQLPVYLKRYRQATNLLVPGDVVRIKKPRENNARIFISPLAQQQMGLYGTPQTGTITESFFERRDPWIVDSIARYPLRRWLEDKLIDGAVNEWPGGVILRPLVESTIRWPETTSFGENKIWASYGLLEKVPADEISKFQGAHS